MKIDLVFDDWVDRKSNESVLYTEVGLELSLGDFHSGTMFSAEIELEDYQGEFETAAEKGIMPVFYAVLPTLSCDLCGEKTQLLRTTKYKGTIWQACEGCWSEST